MFETKGLLKKYSSAFLLAVASVIIIYLIVRHIGAFGRVLLVVIGFGAVVLVHEFGHFIVAKLSDIKVEAFSIGFPPILSGILRTENGWRIRILPDLFHKTDDKSEKRQDAGLIFTMGKKAKPGETEYRVGLIPFGGYVKMLGQEDLGSAKSSDDPRSYANKPVSYRMAVISAGVICNALSAVIIFMTVFLIGINLPPAVVGGVVPNSSAARAGLKAGDEIIEIAGKSENLDFNIINMVAALSDVNETVPLRVKHNDGSVEDFEIVAEKFVGSNLRLFGIEKPLTLTVAEVPKLEKDYLFEKTALLPGDRIKAINGREVQNHWQLEQIVQDIFWPAVTLLAERIDPLSGKIELIESQVELSPTHADTYGIKSESQLHHICSMVPRLQINAVSVPRPSFKDRLMALLGKIGVKRKTPVAEPHLRTGDIILAAGDIENPTYKELRDITVEHNKKQLLLKVLRADPGGLEKTLEVAVVPKRPPGLDRVVIGIGVELDAEHPVIAKTISTENGPLALDIPRGAVITAVDGAKVSNFYDCLTQIRRNLGQRISIEYRLNDQVAGSLFMDLTSDKEFITVKSTLSEAIPFKSLERMYKAAGPIDAIVMGYKKTIMFIAQTYITLKRLIVGALSPKELMGPVGIVTFSYRIVAQRPLVYYVYFIGLISACIAVFNFLPMLPFDGGHIVFLLIEKIKGSPVNERLANKIGTVGWVLVGMLFLYVTFNDIVRSFFY